MYLQGSQDMLKKYKMIIHAHSYFGAHVTKWSSKTKKINIEEF